jgi:hypothetical protein
MIFGCEILAGSNYVVAIEFAYFRNHVMADNTGRIIAPHVQGLIWGRHPDCRLGARSLGPVSPVPIRFVCWPSGKLRAGFMVQSATWSSPQGSPHFLLLDASQ